MTAPAVLVLALLLLGGALAAGGWIYAHYVRPARALHRALAALAGGHSPTPPPLPGGAFQRSAAHLETLAGRLRELDRERRDESFNLQAILGSLSEGVLIVDRAQKIRLVNAGLQRMFDFRAPPLGRTVLEAFRHHAVHAAVREALAGGQPQTRTLALAARQENGRYVEKHFHLTATSLPPASDRGPTPGAIAVFHDVTQLTALEAVRRDFVANVSHELRTPLSIINGYLETLLEPAGPRDEATVRRFLGVMWKHGQRLQHLLDDLLTIARLESGGSQSAGGGLRCAPVELRALLAGVLDRLAPVVAARRAKVTLDVAADAPAVIEADAHQLDQAFFNLLDNALKHGAGPASPPAVCVRVNPDTSGQVVTLTFADDGPGIPLADQAHVFERFYRVHKDRSRDAGGTGLGLAIVKHIVGAHGGRIEVESSPGKGAAFRVRLPVRQQESAREEC